MIPTDAERAFCVYASHLRQASQWTQHNGLERLFRLSKNPNRLRPRYTVDNGESAVSICGCPKPK